MNCYKNKMNIQKGFDSETLRNKKYLKSKRKSYEEKSAQVFMMIEYQKKVFTVFVYQ